MALYFFEEYLFHALARTPDILSPRRVLGLPDEAPRILLDLFPKRMVEHGPGIRAESTAEEARHLLLRALASKFPGLETIPEINRSRQVHT